MKRRRKKSLVDLITKNMNKPHKKGPAVNLKKKLHPIIHSSQN